MAYSAKIVLDSMAPSGSRLTTFEITFPRIVLAEFNTHRMFSRNSASSRAIPVEKMLKRVQEDPFIPISWGKNQKGMQASEDLDDKAQYEAEGNWLIARNAAVNVAKRLVGIGVHKQITNRLLEPFLWHTCIVTATDYANFFAQRCHPDAQPEIRRIAEMMRDLYDTNKPLFMGFGDWHMPYITEDDYKWGNASCGQGDRGGHLRAISVARCARVSYLNHDGVCDREADLALFQKLLAGMHWSPFEHVAQAHHHPSHQSGNFAGWTQYRKDHRHELRTEYPHAEAATV